MPSHANPAGRRPEAIAQDERPQPYPYRVYAQTCSRILLFQYCIYLVTRLAAIMLYYMQLHMDDTIPYIVDDVMILLYGKYGLQIITLYTRTVRVDETLCSVAMHTNSKYPG